MEKPQFSRENGDFHGRAVSFREGSCLEYQVDVYFWLSSETLGTRWVAAGPSSDGGKMPIPNGPKWGRLHQVTEIFSFEMAQYISFMVLV